MNNFTFQHRFNDFSTSMICLFFFQLSLDYCYYTGFMIVYSDSESLGSFQVYMTEFSEAKCSKLSEFRPPALIGLASCDP